MVVFYSGENYQWMLYPTGCKYVGEQGIYILKVSPHRVHINYKGSEDSLTERKQASPLPNNQC